MRTTVEMRSELSEMMRFAMLCDWARKEAETLRKHAAIIEKRSETEALQYLFKAKEVERELDKMKRAQARSNTPGQHRASMTRFEIKMRLLGFE